MAKIEEFAAKQVAAKQVAAAAEQAAAKAKAAKEAAEKAEMANQEAEAASQAAAAAEAASQAAIREIQSIPIKQAKAKAAKEAAEKAAAANQAAAEAAEQAKAAAEAAEQAKAAVETAREFKESLDSIEDTIKSKESEIEKLMQDSAPILEKYPDLSAQYNNEVDKNPREALENLINNAYEKDITSNDNSNLIYYQDLLDRIEEQKIAESIAIKAGKLKDKTVNKLTPKEREKALEKMLNDKGDYPGADINHLTFQGKPIWYSNILKHIASRTAQLTSPEKPYPYYLEPRIAKQSKEEKIAYDLLADNLLNPEYKEIAKRTIDDLEKLKKTSSIESLSDADKRAMERTTNENIEQYVNPKTNDVLDLIQRRALRNFQENIMPKVSAPFIARGSFSTGARTEAQARARRDLMENIMDQETQFLANAYDKARATASEDKKTYLNYKLSKAGIENEEIVRKGKIAEDINKLMDTEHRNKLLDMEALRTIGENQRNVKQRELDLQYEEFKNQEDYPLRKIDILNKMIHQLPVDSITGQSSRLVPNAPTKTEQVSPWQTGAGILGQMAAMNMINKAEGGIIQNHANGDMVSKMKDKFLEDVIARAQNPQSRAQNPWAHYMLGISNSLASSKNPDVVSAIGEGSTYGANQFMNAIQNNKALEDQNLAFKTSIINYLDQAEARKQEKIINELKMHVLLAKLNPEQTKDKHIPSLTPSGQIPVVTYKNGKVSGVRLVDPSGFTGTSNIAPQGIFQSEEGFDLSDSNENNVFDLPKTPTIEDLHNINMRPKLPTNAAEKEEYKQDLKKLEKDKETAEKASLIEGKILNLKSQLHNLPTGITSNILTGIDELNYAFGIGKNAGAKSKARSAFHEVQMVDSLPKAAEIFKPMSNTDAKKALEMSANPSNTMNSIKERLDLSLAAAKITQTKAEAKEIWLSKYGSTRGFDARFNSWLKSIEVFGDKEKNGKVIRRKFNENSLDSWPEIFNPNVLKKNLKKTVNKNDISNIENKSKWLNSSEERGTNGF